MTYDTEWDHRSRGGALDLAYALGWFSIGLGLAELLAPRRLAHAIGMEGSEGVLQAYGVREIGTGIAILASDNPAPWIWARVAGDALDLATLATGLSRDNPRRGNVGVAIGAVAGVTALDVMCAQMLGARDGHRPPLPLAAYERSGFPAPPEQMRGAARDFEVPSDFRAPEALRPFPEGLAAAGVTSPSAPGTGSKASGH